MAITLNKAAVERAKYLIQAGEVTSFDADWNEEKPTPSELDVYLDNHDIEEYGLWFLGENDTFDCEVKEYYEYPYGDLNEVQRSALVHSLAQAQKNGLHDIAKAAQELLDLIDEKAQ